MRAVLATAVAALAIATPAAAVTIPKRVSSALSGAAGQVSTGRDTAKSCQAGSEKAIILKSRHQQVVACEQPPRSNLLTPDSVAKATAAALSVLG